MKNKTTTFPPAALALVLMLLLPACDKNNPAAPNQDNPTVLELPGADFAVCVLDHERGRHPDSAYVFIGEWRDGHFRFGRERLDTMQLNITPDNGIVLEITSDAPGFEGVNASSAARCINIVPDGRGRTTYYLQWVAEGQSVITLWNGEGASRREIRFTATSRREIPLEGIRVRLNGEERLLFTGYDYALPGAPTMKDPDYPKMAADFRGYTREDRSRHVDFEIVGPVPLNANQGELHIAFDDIGMLDHGAMHENLPPHVWLKKWGLYEENLQYNPDFRWFHPFDPGFHPDRSWNTDYLKMPQTYYNDPKFILNPQDLRERFAWVWPTASGLGFHFTVGAGSIEYVPDRGMYYYDKVHQLVIVFQDTVFDSVWWWDNMHL
ncbi:MAG: hypothetical protein IKN60_01445 [Bacteroidales bacterium]|nr:hypothetical protein [Bacteroidales bacterium]